MFQIYLEIIFLLHKYLKEINSIESGNLIELFQNLANECFYVPVYQIIELFKIAILIIIKISTCKQ